MRSTVGIGHASAALQRLLDPLHPDPMGEAKRQIRHLTATELQETMTALLVLHRIAQEVERIAPTEIDTDIDHKAMVRNGQLAEVLSRHRAKQEPARFSKR